MVSPRRKRGCPTAWRPSGPIILRPAAPWLAGVAALVTVSLLTCGCTSVSEYVQNGFKVGPNYSPPPAPVAKDWIDADDVRVRRQSDDLSQWWAVFQRSHARCPRLLRLPAESVPAGGRLPRAGSAGADVDRRGEPLPANAGDDGRLYPQRAQPRDCQQLVHREAVVPPVGLRLQPQLGTRLLGPAPAGGRIRFRHPGRLRGRELRRRLVTLLGDVATNYVQYRTTEQRIKYAQENVDSPAQDPGNRRR